MKKRILNSLILITIAMPATIMALTPGEGIVLDRNTGDYIISYANGVGKLMQSRFVPSTKINPSLSSRFEDYHGMTRYRYTIKNGSSSKQPLIGLIFDPVGNITSSSSLPKTSQDEYQAYKQLETSPAQLAQMVIDNSRIVDSPNGWSCEVMPAGDKEWAGYRIPCSFDDLDEKKLRGLQAGNSVAGFGFYSMDLPGVGVAQLEGFGDMGPSFVDAGPHGEILNQLAVLQQNDYVPRNAAVPTIAVPIPFDATILLDRIRTHVATWPGKQLLDPAFAAQLDRYLVTATNAYRLNNTKAGRENIESVRRLLEHEHKYLDHDDEDSDDTPEHKAATHLAIDRLAARVLDFDLRYVLKRMEKEHEHEHVDGDRKKEQESR